VSFNLFTSGDRWDNSIQGLRHPSGAENDQSDKFEISEVLFAVHETKTPTRLRETPPALGANIRSNRVRIHSAEASLPSYYCRSPLAVTHSCTPNGHPGAEMMENQKDSRAGLIEGLAFHTLECVRMLGTRSADHIRASGHVRRANRPGHMTCNRPQAESQNPNPRASSTHDPVSDIIHESRPEHVRVEVVNAQTFAGPRAAWTRARCTVIVLATVTMPVTYDSELPQFTPAYSSHYLSTPGAAN
jgi:hypothetical protein